MKLQKNHLKITVLACSVIAGILCGCTLPDTGKKASEMEMPDSSSQKETSGVMLQAFSWESQNSSSWWNVIASYGTEIGEYFEYVWFPPCTDSLSKNGYLPRELYNFDKSAYGKKTDLEKAIQAIAPAKAIGDIVINHRVGTSDWGTFTNPGWDTGYKAICKNDEGFTNDTTGMAKSSASERGASDTGDGYDGGRDLDHTNKNVQNGIITWMNDYLKTIGFVGWRYDYVRGFAGKYVGYYNAMSDAEFSVGEHWTGSSSYPILNWISSTAVSCNDTESVPSKAFDFSLKGALNTTFGQASKSTDKTKISNGSYSELASSALLFRKAPAYAVTFVDNHDTGSTQNFWPLDRNDLGPAYVFILTHPGTPCVAWQHIFSSVSDSTASDTYDGSGMTLQTLIFNLINLRKELGITNLSEITVLKSTSSTYAAEITGKNGILTVTLGSKLYGCPSDFTEKYKGTNWAVYVK